MSSRQLDEEAIFHVARGIEDGELRATYLDQICAGDQALRERVEALLAIHEKEQDFLKSNGDIEPTTAQSPITEGPGQQIGRYKLLQKIGEGGFGVVYMAEQSRPVRRYVALKIIKPGMDSNAVIARFEAERQALALMDHPNIARVFDGGTTESGRPYFVMELVKGVPITEYCDKNQLSTHERLELFTHVCQAVQHAHQKGIIHRDLKPSNILTTLHDGQPVVKVIDFGVAKAINQRLTEKTLFTTYGQMVGTPQYMSPEQAEMSGLDVDTRSDIYSLGVLLYELLTSTTPLEITRLRTAGYAELQRIICEDDPPKPSTRLSSTGQQLTIISQHRRATPDRLRKAISGDLDVIVMKCLEKDRKRRYATATELVSDLDRHQNDEPILAQAPTTTYRLAKFVRRNRIGVVVSLLFFALLLSGTVSLIVAVHRARELRPFIEVLRKDPETQSAIRAWALEEVWSGDLHKVETATKVAELAGVPSEWRQMLNGAAKLYQGELDEAISVLEEASQQERIHGRTGIACRALLCTTLIFAGHLDRHVDLLDEIEEISPEDPEEFLFKAQAIMVHEPHLALEYVNTALDDRPDSKLPLIIRAHIGWMMAVDLDDGHYADQAVEDIDAAGKGFLSNPYFAAMDVLAYVTQLRFEANVTEQQRAIAKQKLARVPNYAFRPVLTAWVLECCGTAEEAKKAWQQTDQRVHIYLYHTAAHYYRTKQFDLAKQMLNENEQLIAIARGMTLIDSESGRAEARQIYHQVSQREDPISPTWGSGLRLGLLLGDLDAVRAQCRRWLNSSNQVSDLHQQLLRFLVNEEDIDEVALLRNAKQQSRFQLCQIELLIGLKRLAEGHRDAARIHLTAARDSRVFNIGDFYWARAFLERMKEDKTWPGWLPHEQ